MLVNDQILLRQSKVSFFKTGKSRRKQFNENVYSTYLYLKLLNIFVLFTNTYHFYMLYRAAMKMANIDAVFNFMFTSPDNVWLIKYNFSIFTSMYVHDAFLHQLLKGVCINNLVICIIIDVLIFLKMCIQFCFWFPSSNLVPMMSCILLISVLVLVGSQSMYFGKKHGMPKDLGSLSKVSTVKI